jgi:hypothetical protein
LKNPTKNKWKKKIIPLKESALREAYSKASAAEKGLLERLYPEVQLKSRDFTCLKTFKDVCIEMNVNPSGFYTDEVAYFLAVSAFNKLSIANKDYKFMIHVGKNSTSYATVNLKQHYIPDKYTFHNREACEYFIGYFEVGKYLFKKWVNS